MVKNPRQNRESNLVPVSQKIMEFTTEPSGRVSKNQLKIEKIHHLNVDLIQKDHQLEEHFHYDSIYIKIPLK